MTYPKNDTTQWLSSCPSFCSLRDRIARLSEAAQQNQAAANTQQALVFYKLCQVLIDEALLEISAICARTGAEMNKSRWNESHRWTNIFQKQRDNIRRIIAEISGRSPEDVCDPESVNVGRNDPDPTMVQLIYTCNNVRMYHVNSAGVSSTASNNLVLRILCLVGHTDANLQATFFMQIIDRSLIGGNAIASTPHTDNHQNEAEGANNAIVPRNYDDPWIYPLISCVSPYHHDASGGSFIFPDLDAAIGTGQLNATVGIVVPGAAEGPLLGVLQAIMANVNDAGHESGMAQANLRVSLQPFRLAVRIANQSWPSNYKFDVLVQRKMERILEQHQPPSPPVSQHMKRKRSRVFAPPAALINGMRLANVTTNAAAMMTGYVADNVRNATWSLFGVLAQHGGARLLTSTMNYSDAEANAEITKMFSAMNRFGSACDALEQAATVLATSLRDNTVQRVERNYGPSAGELAAATIDTVGNVMKIGQNMRTVWPKTLR